MFVPPDVAGITKSAGQSMDRSHRGMKCETRKIDTGRKGGMITSVEIRQVFRSRVHDRKIMEGTEECAGGGYRELF